MAVQFFLNAQRKVSWVQQGSDLTLTPQEALVIVLARMSASLAKGETDLSQRLKTISAAIAAS